MFCHALLSRSIVILVSCIVILMSCIVLIVLLSYTSHSYAVFIHTVILMSCTDILTSYIVILTTLQTRSNCHSEKQRPSSWGRQFIPGRRLTKGPQKHITKYQTAIVKACLDTMYRMHGIDEQQKYPIIYPLLWMHLTHAKSDV